eukprot:4598711-Pyramimonas_sp.AAC.1
MQTSKTSRAAYSSALGEIFTGPGRALYAMTSLQDEYFTNPCPSLDDSGQARAFLRAPSVYMSPVTPSRLPHSIYRRSPPLRLGSGGKHDREASPR